jgi:hypothetical protein
MILLRRERSTQAIRAGFRGQHRVQRERELLRRYVTGQKPRPTVWKAAKDQLKIESGGKCGYCEGKAAHVAHGDVEHFRPKSVYWWLAYCAQVPPCAIRTSRSTVSTATTSRLPSGQKTSTLSTAPLSPSPKVSVRSIEER